MPSELRTQRLLLRRWRETDREPFAAINTDPEVMEHVGGRPLTRAESDALLDRSVGQWSTYGHGWYATEVRTAGPWGDPGQLLGFVGLNHHRAFPDEVEIGWRLARPAWGYGLATEAATAVRDLAFERLAVPRLISITVAANRRSWRVMQRLGFRLLHDDVEFEQWRLQVWELPRPSAGPHGGLG